MVGMVPHAGSVVCAVAIRSNCAGGCRGGGAGDGTALRRVRAIQTPAGGGRDFPGHGIHRAGEAAPRVDQADDENYAPVLLVQCVGDGGDPLREKHPHPPPGPHERGQRVGHAAKHHRARVCDLLLLLLGARRGGAGGSLRDAHVHCGHGAVRRDYFPAEEVRFRTVFALVNQHRAGSLPLRVRPRGAHGRLAGDVRTGGIEGHLVRYLPLHPSVPPPLDRLPIEASATPESVARTGVFGFFQKGEGPLSVQGDSGADRGSQLSGQNGSEGGGHRVRLQVSVRPGATGE
mmetsp:Transcript_2671/g.6232  ORF Transcript_2671/g.6232 Transcript_2671/m.6232 type:complete len:289 (+) Transcript_2671:823-1689(+)